MSSTISENKFRGPAQFRVANIYGSSVDKPHGGARSWLDYWTNCTGINNRNIRCQIDSCNDYADVGGHVYAAANAQGHERDSNHFILPLCHAHNKSMRHDCKGLIACGSYMKTRPTATLAYVAINPKIAASRALMDEVSYESPYVHTVTSSEVLGEVLAGQKGTADIMLKMADCPACERTWPKFCQRAAEGKVDCYVVDCNVSEEQCDKLTEDYPAFFHIRPQTFNLIERFELRAPRNSLAPAKKAQKKPSSKAARKVFGKRGSKSSGAGRTCGNCHHKFARTNHSTWRECPYKCTYRECTHGNNSHKGKACKKR